MSETRLSQQDIDKIAEKGRESLFFFTRAILGFDKMAKDIHKPMCRELEDYTVNRRLEVIVPRSWYKSTLVSISYSIWRAIKNPNIRVLIVQNSFSNACKKLNEIKEIFETNKLFRACYPEILPDGSRKWSSECLTVNRNITAPEGTFEAAGTGTATTSRHYDIIIEDDTVSPDKDALTGMTAMPTQAEIEKAIGWHRLAYPLLIDPSESQIIVVGTRWAERDLLSWVMENSPEYKIISRAAREDENGKPATKEYGGKPVWERFNDEVLDQMERNLGPYMFASLYMNSPMSAGNQLFKADWINYYSTLPKTDMTYITSVDVASADAEESSDPDYNIILTCAVNPNNGHVYVVHYTRERMNPGSVIGAIFDHYRAYKPVKVLIESISYQRTLNYWLKQKQDMLKEHFYVEEIKSLRGSKVDRVRGLQPYFANTKIFLKTEMRELESEILSFPKGAHDDLIDCMSLQISSWNEVTDLRASEIKYKQSYNPHSFRHVIGELQERASTMNRYPYDMGLLKYRHKPLRDYVNN